MPWKTITVPKTVWLPTAAPDGSFKDSGLRAEPSDTIEIETGTSNIRVNGAPHRLLISCDGLRLDKNNCLQLDKPAPPVANISANGGDRAFVGGLGQATAAARGRWDQKAASSWKGDAATPIGKSWVEAQISHAERRGDFEDFEDLDDPETTALFEEDPNDTPKQKRQKDRDRLQLLEEERVVRTVTLKDGTTAEVLIDPSTGRQAGFVTRTYSGPGVDPKEAARMMAEQAQEAQDVTYKVATPVLGGPSSAAKQQPDLRASRAALAEGIPIVLRPADPPPATIPALPTGLGVTLDGFLGSVLPETGGGFPRGGVTYLQVASDIYDAVVTKMALTQVIAIEPAFARIHMCPISRPGVLVRLSNDPEGPTDALRLEIAEQLLVLVDVVKEATHKVAVVLVSPLWGPDKTPTLLTRFTTAHLRLEAHQDPRFLLATILTKGQPGRSVTFPKE